MLVVEWQDLYRPTIPCLELRNATFHSKSNHSVKFIHKRVIVDITDATDITVYSSALG